MKYLFIVQGEGRGHLTQAITMYDLLTRNGHEVVEVLVGTNGSLTLPAFFRRKMQGCRISTFESPSFLFSRTHKKTLLLDTIVHNLRRLPVYPRNIAFINRRIKASGADRVINFYEVLTGLTYALYRPSKPYICVAHQYLFLHSSFVHPKKNRLEVAALRLFTWLTAIHAARLLALSFTEMPHEGRIRIVPPLLREEVLKKTAANGDYILGYMLHAGFSEDVMAWHRRHEEVAMHVFWDKSDAPDELQAADNLVFHRLDDASFLDYMSRCKAYASTGGFESICEAMYLGKPVMMVPAHIEQECNAWEAMNAGAGIVSPEFDLTRLVEYLPDYRANDDFAKWVSRTNGLMMEALGE
jgi:uncharacterized protein (TIGR00661 family)